MTREEQAEIKAQNELKRINETILLCTEFLLTNLSDIELSNKTGISSSTVGRRLKTEIYIEKSYDKVKSNLISAGFNEDEIPKNGKELYDLISSKRRENLLKGKALGGQTTLLNHVYLKGEDTLFQGVAKLSLGAIYSNIEDQYRFLINAALYFHLHLDTLSELFQIDEKELYDNMLKYGSRCYEALRILFEHDTKNQEEARAKFLNYYQALNEAIRHKKNDEKKELITIISDKKAVILKRKIQETKAKNLSIKLTDDDIETLIKYQLKYFLLTRDIVYMFDINRSSYLKRVTTFLESNIELKKEYEDLMIYNEYKYKTRNGDYRGY